MNRHLYTAVAAIWVLGLATVTVAFPGIPAGSAAAQGIGQATYGGVTFSYDNSVARRVMGQTIPSNVGQGLLFSEVRPEHTCFSFDGYSSKGMWTPGIRVIPLAAYKVAQSESGGSPEF